MKYYTIKNRQANAPGPLAEASPCSEQEKQLQKKARSNKRQKIAAIDLHPDIFDCVVLNQAARTADAKKEKAWCEIPTENMIEWATKELDPEIHLIVIEATSNTFDSVTKLTDKGFSSIVVESNQVSKVSDAFLDSDQIAAERIGRCYLTGLAKVVWVPDEKTRERREILHAYNKSVTDCTRANNELKSYLTGFNVRPGKRNLMLEEHRDWVRKKLPMTPTREIRLEEFFANLDRAKESKDRFYEIICREMAGNKKMLNCLRVVGIGLINAFAIVSIVGDINRFATPKKLVSYVGLNPGSKKSGRGKDIKIGVGNRGRKDMRTLLIQAAQAVLRKARADNNKLAKWGFKLFARKGNRNVAVAAIARKLVQMLYYILKGHIVDFAEQRKPMERKLYTISRTLGPEGRREAGLSLKPKEAVSELFTKSGWPLEEQGQTEQ